MKKLEMMNLNKWTKSVKNRSKHSYGVNNERTVLRVSIRFLMEQVDTAKFVKHRSQMASYTQ